MFKRGQVRGDKTRVKAMEAFEIQAMKAPGLRPIKQIELYKKFCPFVTRELPAAKAAPKKMVWRAPNVKNAICLAMATEAAKSDDSTESDLSE
jgi:hypothetical protein